MSAHPSSKEPEFSHIVTIDKIPAGGTVRNLEANEMERRKLMARFGLLDLPSLRADVTVTREGQGIEVKGHLSADAVQKCVVTLEPVPEHIERDIQVFYTFEEPEEGEIELEPNAVEVETIANGAIDLGELVAQNFGIALDPYPRKPGAALPAVNPTVDKPASPLAQLAEWKKKQEE